MLLDMSTPENDRIENLQHLVDLLADIDDLIGEKHQLEIATTIRGLHCTCACGNRFMYPAIAHPTVEGSPQGRIVSSENYRYLTELADITVPFALVERGTTAGWAWRVLNEAQENGAVVPPFAQVSTAEGKSWACPQCGASQPEILYGTKPFLEASNGRACALEVFAHVGPTNSSVYLYENIDTDVSF